jgi:transcription initiation factor TFIID subunit 1
MRTNKLCPKYGEDPDTLELDANSVKSNPTDSASHVQTKTPFKRLITKVSSEVTETEGPGIDKTKSVPVKFKCGAPDKSLERNMSLSTSLVSDKRSMDASEFRSTGKVNKLVIPNRMKSDDHPPDTPKPSVVFRPPAEEKDIPRKKITIKQPKGLEQQRHEEPRSGQEPIRKTRRIVELSSFEEKIRQDGRWFAGEPSQINSSHERGLALEEKRNKAFMENGQSWRDFEEQREMPQQRLVDARIYASREEDHQKSKKKNKKKKKHEFRDDDLLDHRPYRNDRRAPDRHVVAKRRTPTDVVEYAPSAKRRRGGEVPFLSFPLYIMGLCFRNVVSKHFADFAIAGGVHIGMIKGPRPMGPFTTLFGPFIKLSKK